MKVILINPPIYDFAAYDFWMKPLGLLYLSSLLREKGHNVMLIDAVNRNDEFYSEVKSDRFGRGKFNAVEVEKPEILKDIPRKYRRYGIPEHEIKSRIVDFSPDYILISCTMTYWYPGVIEIANIAESLKSQAVLFLGGIYPTLLPEHARSLECSDRIYTLNDRSLDELDVEIPENFSDFPPPDYTLYPRLEYAVIATSLGCPFDCPYCSAPLLYEGKQDKDIGKVVEEINHLSKRGIRRFALYDDALLLPEERFLEFCEEVEKRKIPALFFTPNGLHSRYISPAVADAMMRAGFREPRISLETSDEGLQRELNLKTTFSEFREAVGNLIDAGYSGKHIYTYIMAGLPGQSFESVRKSIMDVGKVGVKVSLAEFSPIPGTPLGVDMEDPLLTNNTAYYYYRGMDKEMDSVKALVKWVNKGIDLEIPVGEIKDYL